MSDYIFEDPNSDEIRNLYPDALKQMLVPQESVKINRWYMFNKITGGFRPFEFSILCGATGSGKTTLLANISLELVKQEIPHFVASVETGHLDFISRMVSADSGNDWNTGDPVSKELLTEYHATAGRKIQKSKMWLSLYDNRFDTKKLMNDIAWHVRENKIKIAFVDNMNFFLEVTAANQVIVEMDRVIHDLIIFCKRTPVHIVMVMHPKKTDGGRVVSEFDVKGSSTSVQEAHNVFLFNRPDPSLLKLGLEIEPNDRELTLAKMRRKGKFVGSKLILKTKECVRYEERILIER